jgi:catechol 2,3-dioxygenase-like lactoylglutathione lyase family enzyme
MSTTEDRSSHANGTASVGSFDTKLEVLVIPVSDVDRAKEFYGGLGWRLDADRAVGEEFHCAAEVTTRLPSRIDAAAGTTFASAADLASAMVRAALAHGQHEKRIGAAGPDWPGWYAAYMVAEQAGTELPT